MAGELEVLTALVDRTHGVAVGDIECEPVAASRAERRAFWAAVWRELGFAGWNAAGSSRLMHVAWPLAVAGEGASALLLGMFDVLGESALPVDKKLEFLVNELRIGALVDRPRFGAAFDFLAPLPAPLTDRQAFLVARFAWDRSRYTDAELEPLRLRLGGGSWWPWPDEYA